LIYSEIVSGKIAARSLRVNLNVFRMSGVRDRLLDLACKAPITGRSIGTRCLHRSAKKPRWQKIEQKSERSFSQSPQADPIKPAKSSTLRKDLPNYLYRTHRPDKSSI
jgi:hypothetical protein